MKNNYQQMIARHRVLSELDRPLTPREREEKDGLEECMEREAEALSA